MTDRPGVKHINVQIPEDLHDEVKEAIPWGLRGHLFQSILRLILEAIREDGQIVLGAVISGEYRLSLARRATTHNPNLISDSSK